MSTVNHTPLGANGPLTQVAMEAPLGQLDAAIEVVRDIAEAAAAGGGGGSGGGTGTTSPWIDIRDYGALGNFHDDTAALQAAVNYLTKPRADDWQSLAIYAAGGTFTLKYGASTTGPIAFNATGATIQTALQALPSIGAGNVTVVDWGAGMSNKWRATFVGALSAVTTGVHNQDLVINPAGLTGTTFLDGQVQVSYWNQGMGGDINCPDIHGISSTVLIQSSNIRIHAGRDAPGMAGTAYSQYPPYTYPINSGLVWVGADLGGPMVWFKAGQGEPLSGIGFHGSLHAGRFNMATGAFPSAANVGLRVDGATHSDFDVHTVEFKDVGFWVRACDTNPEIHHQWRGNNFLDIRRVSGRQWLHNGNVFRCDARDLQQGNSYYTRVGMIDFIHRNGDAVVLGNSDTWMIGIIGGYRVSGGTGAGVRFKATPASFLPVPPNPPGTIDYNNSSGMHRITIIEHADPGSGSFVFEGSDVNTITPCFIEIRNWRTPNVGTPANPTIGPGVDGIYWRILRNPALPMSGTAFPAQP